VCWGLAFPHGGPDPGGLRDCPRGGVRRGLPRLLTIVRGTPVPGYRQWPPGPPQGRLRPCRWGQSLADVPFPGTCLRNGCQSIFSHAACPVCSHSRQVRGPHLRRFRRAARGVSYCRRLKNMFQRPLGDVRSCVMVCLRGGTACLPRTRRPVAWFSRYVTCGPGPPCRGSSHYEY
jgi:hypothetical protein